MPARAQGRVHREAHAPMGFNLIEELFMGEPIILQVGAHVCVGVGVGMRGVRI